MKVLSACLLGYLGTACAWSFAGHELIAHVASDLLSADARHRIHSILGGSHLSTIATWADSITWLPQYKYSSVLHYYNAPHDDPPHDCGLRWTQPGGQDVIAAIHNYTSILKTAEDGSWAQSEALRFLVHFLQDMHQPLHLSGRARGGNDVFVHFDGYKTNLHKVWDGLGLMKRMRAVLNGINTIQSASVRDDAERDERHVEDEESLHELMTTYHAYIADLLQTDHYVEVQQKWLRCPHTSIDPAFGCPEIWALDVAPLNCEYTWKDVVEDGTLSAEYWRRIEDDAIIEELVMRSAVRLAAVLNSVFEHRSRSKHDGL